MRMAQRLKKGWHGFWVDYHSPAPPIVTLENLDVLEWEERLKLAKVDNLYLVCKDYWGSCYYDTRVGYMHPGLTFDFVGEMAQMLKANHIEFVACYSLGLDTHAVNRHPAWGARDARYKIQRVMDGDLPKWHRCCTMTEYMKLAIEQIEEILEAYEPDGLYLDAFDHPMCYCDDCQRGFREKYGLPIPKRRTDFRRYIKQCNDFQSEMVDLKALREVKALAKKIHPKMWISVSNSLSLRRKLRETMDCHIAMPEASFWENLMWAKRVAAGQCLQTLVCGLNQSQDFSPSCKTEVSVAKAVDQSARPVLCSPSMKPDGSLDRLEFERASSAYAQLGKYSKILAGGRPINSVAVISHELTQSILPEALQKEKAIQAIQYMGLGKLPIEVILDEDLTPMKLASFQVLVLPNVMCLQREAVKTILNFVKRGGALLATEQTSLCDEQSLSRNEFLLSEAFGCDFCGINTDYLTNPWGSFLELDQHAIWKQLSLFHEPPVPPPYIKLRLTTGTSVATHILPATAQSETSWVGWGTPPGSTLTQEPAVVLNQYGKGRCLYAGFDLFNPSIPWTRPTAANFLEWLVPNPAAKMEAAYPSSFKVSYAKKEKTILVHVINDLPQILNEESAPIPAGTLIINRSCASITSAEQLYPKTIKLKVKASKEDFRINTLPVETHAIFKLSIR